MLYYAPVHRGFTQHGTARCAMRRGARRGVTIAFHRCWADWTQMSMLLVVEFHNLLLRIMETH